MKYIFLILIPVISGCSTFRNDVDNRDMRQGLRGQEALSTVVQTEDETELVRDEIQRTLKDTKPVVKDISDPTISDQELLREVVPAFVSCRSTLVDTEAHLISIKKDLKQVEGPIAKNIRTNTNQWVLTSKFKALLLIGGIIALFVFVPGLGVIIFQLVRFATSSLSDTVAKLAKESQTDDREFPKDIRKRMNK